MTLEHGRTTSCPSERDLLPQLQQINELARRYWSAPKQLMSHIRANSEDLETLCQASTQAGNNRKVENILIFFHALGIGGGERVTCALAEIWQRLGMRVTIVTDVPLDESSAHQVLPNGVRHKVIPDYNTLTNETYHLRSTALSKIIEEEHADAIVFAHWFAESLPYDILTCKLHGMKTYLFIQSLFSLFLLDDIPTNEVEMPLCYGLADGVISLSETDRSVWSCFNPHSYVTCNPATYSIAETPAPLQGHSIIWPARLHPDKCPERVIPIMQELLRLVPDASLKMVGPVDEAYAEQFMRDAHHANVDHAIQLCGEQAPKAMDSFYSTSDVFLLTSRREGWSLAMAEALAQGIPCVIYALPYLTLAKNNPAVIQVEQDDAKAAAQAIAELLIDKQRAHDLSRAAQDFVRQIADYDYEGFWEGLFNGPTDETDRVNTDYASTPESLAIRAAFSAHRDCLASYRAAAQLTQNHIDNLEGINAALTEQCAKLQGDFEAVAGSASFKVGRAITAVPRKIKSLVLGGRG